MKKIYVDNISNEEDKTQLIKSLILNDRLEIELIYKSSFPITKSLRDFIEVVGRVFCLPDKFIARIILISDELNNNAIEYGSNENGENILRLRVDRTSESIDFNLEVQDNGKGKSPKTALDMETLRAHRLKKGYSKHDSIRGRGLFLITVQIVDRLYFKNAENGGLIVGVKKEFINKKTD